jgi:DNA-binding transcriptional LysR family regulator
LLWKDFAMTKWILREKGSGTREIFEQAIFNKLTPDVLLELGHSEAIKQAVMTGVGLSCISRHVIAQELLQKQLVILPTPERPMLRQLWQITHKQRYHAPVLKAFQTFLV